MKLEDFWKTPTKEELIEKNKKVLEEIYKHEKELEEDLERTKEAIHIYKKIIMAIT